MALTGQNFEMWAKDTVVLNITTTDEANINAIDITGMSISWVLFRGTSTYANKTIGSGVEIIDGTNGTFQVTILPADTVSLTGLFNHECYMVDQFGNQTTIFTG